MAPASGPFSIGDTGFFRTQYMDRKYPCNIGYQLHTVRASTPAPLLHSGGKPGQGDESRKRHLGQRESLDCTRVCVVLYQAQVLESLIAVSPALNCKLSQLAGWLALPVF